jgi:hypothetical protein
MRALPPLEFTLDGPGLTLEQLRAVFRYQQELKERRRAREAEELVRKALEDAANITRAVQREHEIL